MKKLDRQQTGLIALLADDDPATVDLVKAQLAAGGMAALPELFALADAADGIAAFHLWGVIAGIDEAAAQQSFADLCAHFGEHGDLEEAAWGLSAVLSPGEDFDGARTTLDAWGAEVARRLRQAGSALDRVETLSEFLNLEQRVRGNDSDYYGLRNSVLGAVIESGLGNPITLSLLYILVARRAGMTVSGVGLPGHFVVRHEDVFFDPFHGGRRIGLKDCRALLEQQNLALAPSHLAPTTARQMFLRMLTNIFHIAGQTDPALAKKVAGWIEMLSRSEDASSASEPHRESHG